MKAKHLLTLCLSLSLLTSLVFADAEQERPTTTPLEQLQDGEHITVGSDPLPAELQEQMENERIEKYQKFKSQTEQKLSQLPTTQPIEKALALPGYGAKAQLAAYSRAMHTHYLVDISYDGRFLDTEDGSRWEVAESDMGKVLRWRFDQTYIITPNSNWLSSSQYPYTITNQQRGASAKVKLILGPSAEGQNVHWVINYDPYLRLVYLENGTVWKVAEDDYPYFAKWDVNDIIIIGNYYPWFYIFYPYDTILIDVTRNHYVHAKMK